MPRNKLIALDADGVLLDYNYAYATAWKRAFGHLPGEKCRKAYWAIDRWDVLRLHGEDLEHFRSVFDEEFWSNVPAIEGALEACRVLVDADCQLVCVTALPDRFKLARSENLRRLGFPIDDVIAVEHSDGDVSPKADRIREINPMAFVDDYLPYLNGLPDLVHKALIARDPEGSPNFGPALSVVDSEHLNLLAFAKWWTSRPA